MLIKFSGQDNILDSKPFINDEVQFNLLHLIRESKSPLLYMNENRNVIIGQSTLEHPVWIWTLKEIENEDIEELKNDFTELYEDVDVLTFVARPDIAVTLAEYYCANTKMKYHTHLQMESFKCSQIIETKSTQGFLRKAVMNDISVISEFLSGFIYGCFGKKATSEEQLEVAKAYIKSANLYVWCKDNEVISMANIAHCSKRQARINQVYTKPNMRGKGFGAMIVSELSKIILSGNKVPVLYTDLSNPASNKAYKNVGFVECGKVTQVVFDSK